MTAPQIEHRRPFLRSIDASNSFPSSHGPSCARRVVGSTRVGQPMCARDTPSCVDMDSSHRPNSGSVSERIVVNSDIHFDKDDPTRAGMEFGRSMGKRIRNYRSGDRAEDLGIFLLRAFCAVAPIPRQEDFGLADAVATLLRPEGRFWYAEDSFLVQFKSRTEKKVTLEGPVFERWLAQDLSILVGRVNLIENTIELFTVGAALFDRRVHEAKGLVLWLINGEEGLHDGVLHLKTGKADPEVVGSRHRGHRIHRPDVRRP